jgi:hypothetical protein
MDFLNRPNQYFGRENFIKKFPNSYSSNGQFLHTGDGSASMRGTGSWQTGWRYRRTYMILSNRSFLWYPPERLKTTLELIRRFMGQFCSLIGRLSKSGSARMRRDQPG